MLSSVVAKPLTRTIGETSMALSALTQSSLITQARSGDELLRKITVHYREVFLYIKYMTSLGPEKAFSVHSRGVFTQDKSGYFSNIGKMRKMGLGKSIHYIEVFTNQGCSL